VADWEYKYYDVDHAIARAQTPSHRILAGITAREIARGAA
jgi:hypothetical protein